MPEKKTSNAKYQILIDTNIFQYLSGSDFSNQLITFLDGLSKNGHPLVISEVTIAELIAGRTKEQEIKALKELDKYKKYDVSRSVLIGAARVHGFYNEEGIPGMHDPKITLGDRILASTSIITGSPILTANIRHFPRPFFSEAHEEKLEYKKKGKTELQVVQILKPNIEFLRQKLNNRK